MKEILRAKISSLVSTPGGEVYNLIGDSEIESIINHIAPSK
jgi:hypothetical protein